MKQRYYFFGLGLLLLACSLAQPSTSRQINPTKTALPTFTQTPTLAPPTNTPLPTATATLVVVPTEVPTNTSTPEPIPTEIPTETAIPPTDTPLSPPPTDTPIPLPTDTPTVTPTPEPLIKYVLAGSSREFNCEATYIYGTVQNANNFGLPGVQVRALGIHETTGLDFVVETDGEGRYEIFRIPLNDLLAAQWAVMLMEDGREVSERFHWASTPVCESDDFGHSQVLRIDWKLIE